MSLFRKKEEVLISAGAKGRGRKGKRLPKVELPEDEAPRAEPVTAAATEDEYAASFLPEDLTEEAVTAKKKKGKKPKKEKKKKTPKREVPFYRNRVFVGVLCIVAASLIAFVGVPVMSYISTTETTTVARMTVPLEKGKRIEQQMVRTVEVPALWATTDVLPDARLAVGKYAAVDLVAGDYIMESKLTEVMPFPNDYLYQVPSGSQAISLTIQSFASGLSGKLLPGDIVSVYATPNQREADDTDYHAIQPPELVYVRVLAVTNRIGGDRERDDAEQEEGMDEDTQPFTVTLLVSPAQAKAAAGLEINAKLHLTLVSRGDEQAAAAYLKAQGDYLEEQARKAKEEAEETAKEAEEEPVSSGAEETEAPGEPGSPGTSSGAAVPEAPQENGGPA